MKTISLMIGLVLISSFSLFSQSAEKGLPITQKSFKVKLKVEKNRTFSFISFISSKGQKRKAKVTDPGKLSSLKLKPGTILEGTYQFSTFASEGGLGTTRIVRGEGKGSLTNCVIVTEVNPMVSKLAGVGDLAVRLY